VEGVAERVLAHLKSTGKQDTSQAGPHLQASSMSASGLEPDHLEFQCLKVLRGLLGKPNATWTCPEQWSSLREIRKLKRDVLAIMKTGSGKSMLVILPSIMEEDQVTVAILPFTSLIMDYSRKLNDLKVPFEVFKSNVKLHGQCNLILVSADLAKGSWWRQEIAQLNERRPVVRIIFDEGHLAFTASSYRKPLQDLYNLRQFPLQIVVLSGTVPPKSEQLVINAFGLSDPFIVRTSSNRPELEYILEKPFQNMGSIIERIQEITTSFRLRSKDPNDRYLIFVPYIQDGRDIADILNVDFYYTGKDDYQLGLDARQKIFDDWLQGKKTGMVCTSAFGAGNDYSHVRLVVHAGAPKEMIGYAQESGRGGRDGKLCSCHILPKKNKGKSKEPEDEDDHQGSESIQSLIYDSSPTQCLRFQITSFCDPVGTYCRDDPKNQLCSGCVSTPSFLSPTIMEPSHQDIETPSLKRSLHNAFGEAYEGSRTKRIEKQVLSEKYVDRFYQALKFYSGSCAYCLGSNGSRQMAAHDMKICYGFKSKSHWYSELKMDIKYSDHHPPICWKCHVPQCHDKLHEEFVISESACEFKEIILPVFMAAFGRKRKEMCREFGQKWEDMLHAVEWFNQKPIKGHQSNLSALFLWYYYEHQVKK
jgi:superfamily II DNA helicase RecQ